MSVSSFVRLLVAAIALSLLGYAAGSLLGITSFPVISLFATGLLLGCLAGGLLVTLGPAWLLPDEDDDDETGSSIYVGNLPFNAGEDDVKNLFAPYGEVIDVRLVKDRRSRRPKGYGFVEMSQQDANSAIAHLDGTEYAGRTLRVNEGKKKES